MRTKPTCASITRCRSQRVGRARGHVVGVALAGAGVAAAERRALQILAEVGAVLREEVEHAETAEDVQFRSWRSSSPWCRPSSGSARTALGRSSCSVSAPSVGVRRFGSGRSASSCCAVGSMRSAGMMLPANGVRPEPFGVAGERIVNGRGRCGQISAAERLRSGRRAFASGSAGRASPHSCRRRTALLRTMGPPRVPAVLVVSPIALRRFLAARSRSGCAASRWCGTRTPSPGSCSSRS